jgi:hypothetical protein
LISRRFAYVIINRRGEANAGNVRDSIRRSNRIAPFLGGRRRGLGRERGVGGRGRGVGGRGRRRGMEWFSGDGCEQGIDVYVS